ncbi:hypothetical protein SAMN05518800_7051 [Variovorax sp. YR752]|uniref:hypothetical protein n=1 Tax=unclassified Variovorax TaxID=663243 RepID=UPI000BD3AE5E|nr:hypothetical protein [Variovorax sp. YR752]SOE06401.1 hypothetical protein SAMN05518800_7051 [Variovorax sp. YR752]
MLELGIAADLIRGLAWAVRALFIGLIVLALWRGRTWKLKIFYVVVTVLAFFSPQFPQIARDREHKREYEKAKAVFDERCKTAGEKIYKTVDDVEGVLLLNQRPSASNADRYDANWPDAGLPQQFGGESYIANFLRWESNDDERRPRGALNDVPSNRPGYRYVDAKGKDGEILRYTLRRRDDPAYPHLAKTELESHPARYAVSFANLINPEDRKLWVAGTTVTVTDTQTSEVIAQATWFSFEPSLGRRAAHSTPWAYAISCPELRGGKERAPTRFFVDQVLKPKGRD